MDKNVALKLSGLFVAGGLVGGTIGFAVGFKKGFNKAWEDANAEIEDQEEVLMRRYKVGRYADPRDFVDIDTNPTVFLAEVPPGMEPVEDVRAQVDAAELAQLKEHLESQEYAGIKPGNVFVQYGDKEVHQEGPAEVTPNMVDPEPYVIEELEFLQEEEFQTVTLEWYAGDRVLANENDEIIDDVEGHVGINNLNRIGPSLTVLYVRNPKLETVFEIALRLGTYRDTVLGLNEEETINNERPVRRRTRGLGE